jgi:hypothetical protein
MLLMAIIQNCGLRLALAAHGIFDSIPPGRYNQWLVAAPLH